MTTKSIDTVAIPEPWNSPHASIIAELQKFLPFDRLLLACPHALMPQPDEMLLMHGWPAGVVMQWFTHQAADDKLLRTTLRHGLLLSDSPHSDTPSPLLPAGSHALSLALADSLNQKRWWWLLVVRQQQGFTLNEQQLMALWLRRWMMRYGLPGEKHMRQLLIGHDQRLILADLESQKDLILEPSMPGDWLRSLPEIMEQRYPGLEDHEPYDMVLPIGGKAQWIVLRRSRAVDDPNALHWHLELRPIDEDDLPAVGMLKDDRIAQAVAYIHQNFAESPSLTEISRTVHISPFHFHRLFSKQVGLSPKIYLQKKQLQMAKWLLRQGGTPIGKVANSTGFSSHGHFTSTFHRIVGVSPSDYRDQS